MNRPPEQSRKALGKGLSALLPTRPAVAAAPAEAPSRESVVRVAIEDIDANPVQPRRVFEAERMEELAQSIRANGIIQPLVVRRNGDRLQLVAGERRLRAARLAGVREVPVVVQDVPDERLLEITLIENLQREDLNPIEAAQAFERLGRELNMGPEEIGLRTGKDRSTIVNLVRLLQLPPEVQEMVADRRLTAGHARCLLSLPTASLRREVAEKLVARGLSVREAERLTKRLTAAPERKAAEEPAIDPNVKAAIVELERALGTKVRIIEKSGGRGQIEIEYYSSEDLDRIYSLITGHAA
jgi:ParB family transcriptional regulator, chromosome partitioning protein